jgi:hypothetical protein
VNESGKAQVEKVKGKMMPAFRAPHFAVAERFTS